MPSERIMDRPEAFQTNIITGLYLFQMLYRRQLNDHPDLDNGIELALSSDIDTSDQKDIDNVAIHTLNMARSQLGLQQILRLTTGLFNMPILKALAEQIVEHEQEINWDAVGDNIPVLADLYHLNGMFRPYLDCDLGRVRGDSVHKAMMELPKLLDSAVWGGYFSTNSDYTYMLVWKEHFPTWTGLQKAFQDVGCHPRDDDHDSNAVENLMNGDTAVFEAFCYLNSLTVDQARYWEDMVVGWGHTDRKGSVDRAIRIKTPESIDLLMAGALSAGFPVHDREAESPYADLIMQINGFINFIERQRVNLMIEGLAPILYMELTNADTSRYKSQKWRGVPVSPGHLATMNYLDDNVDVDLIPILKLRASKYANRNTSNNYTVSLHGENYTGEPSSEEEFFREGGEIAARRSNRRPSANRVIYLVDQLCEIIHNDFTRLGYFS